MKLPARIILIASNGTDDMTRRALKSEEFAALPDPQNMHVYFEETELGARGGICDAIPMHEMFGPYPGGVFAVVFEGGFKMLDAASDGTSAKQSRLAIGISRPRSGNAMPHSIHPFASEGKSCLHISGAAPFWPV